MSLEKKYDTLTRILKDLGKVAIAYSGGVDSTFLLKAAVETIGAENVLACIGLSPSLGNFQHTQALDMAKIIGIAVLEIQADELADTKYAQNKADRCFHCKSHLYGLIKPFAKAKGFDVLICGSNLDDMDDYRPGNRAAKVFEVRAPLAEAELTKPDIRKLSKELNLPTAEMPASPCLASRINYGLKVTAERLKQVEQAEDFLRELGLVDFRVRHHETVARIEVKPADIEKITAEPVRTKIIEKIKSLGFKYITVDLQGFRSGSLNETLSEEEKQTNL